MAKSGDSNLPISKQVLLLASDAALTLVVSALPIPGMGMLKDRLAKWLGINPQGAIDERIRKIDAARDNLMDALIAIDELKYSAEQNKAELELLKLALAKAAADKGNLEAQNQDLQKLAEVKVDTVRSALGIPSAWEVRRGYVVSFFVGIISTIALSLAYDFIFKPVLMHIFHLTAT